MAKSDTPAKVSLNLDTLENEGAKEPFVIVLGGTRYELQDPEDADYRDLLEAQEQQVAGNPRRAVELLVKEEDREVFFANKLPTRKLGVLFEKYNAHYGLGAPGESDASSGS